MRVTQRMMVDTLRQNINRNGESLIELQDQLASGKRLRKPSDDPQSLSRALSLRAASDQNDQYVRNITMARGWLEATDSSLDKLTEALTNAHDLALRGASDSMSSDARRALAMQVDGVLEGVLQAVSASHEGKYLFSGFKTTTAPFQAGRDPASGQITAVSYQGDSGQIGRDIGPDTQITLNLRGNDTVGGQPVLLQALESLIGIRDRLNGIPTADPTQELGQLTDQVGTVVDGITALRGSVGAKMKRLDVTEKALTEEHTNLAAMLSRAQDADAAEVMTKLMMQQTIYQASLSTGARVIQLSLLDFLK